MFYQKNTCTQLEFKVQIINRYRVAEYHGDVHQYTYMGLTFILKRVNIIASVITIYIYLCIQSFRHMHIYIYIGAGFCYIDQPVQRS